MLQQIQKYSGRCAWFRCAILSVCPHLRVIMNVVSQALSADKIHEGNLFCVWRAEFLEVTLLDRYSTGNSGNINAPLM